MTGVPRVQERLILLTKDQFGYHTDFFMYAKYLAHKFDVEVICLDKGLSQFQVDGVTVNYIKSKGRLGRWLKLLLSILDKTESSIVLVKYFPGCFLLRALRPKTPIILDVRTLSVDHIFLKRKIEDFILKAESIVFRYVTLVSKQLKVKMWGKLDRYFVVRLGAEPTLESSGSVSFSCMDRIELLYVGTLHNRNIDQLVIGLHQFCSINPKNPYHLTVIGSGYRGEEAQIQNLISRLHLESRVTFMGYVGREHIGQHFANADIGIVHVPNVSYFEVQPSTKLYEYWSYGLPVLASEYSMNVLEVSEGTGYLYPASAQGFCEALGRILDKDLYFDRSLIAKKSSQNSWPKIVDSELIPVLSLSLQRT